MSDADWWARKLGGQPAAQPSTAPVQPAATPSPYWGYQPQQHPSPAQAPVQPSLGGAPVGPPSGGYWSYDTNGMQRDDDGHVAMLNDAAQQTGGTRKMKEANGVCPECNGHNYFARTTNEQGMPLRNPAVPQCFDCGYPVIQTGSGGGSLGKGTSTKGMDVRHARQLPPSHSVEVVLEGGQRMIYPGAN